MIRFDIKISINPIFLFATAKTLGICLVTLSPHPFDLLFSPIFLLNFPAVYYIMELL